MAGAATQNMRQTGGQKVDPSTRPWPVRILSGVIGLWVFLFITVFFAIVIEFVGIACGFWPQPGAQHAQFLLDSEMGFLGMFSEKDGSLLSQAQWLVAWTERFAWSWNPLAWVFTFAGYMIDSPQTQGVMEYIKAAHLSAQLVAIRCVVSILIVPAFLLVGIVAFVDGLVLRELRKFGGGHESALIYHWAHRHLKPLIVTPWIVYLSSPFSIHPDWIFLPCIAAFGIALSVATSKFKKVL